MKGVSWKPRRQNRMNFIQFCFQRAGREIRMFTTQNRMRLSADDAVWNHCYHPELRSVDNTNYHHSTPVVID
jgi:hypothetical protein